MLAAAKGSVQIVAIADLFPDRLDVAMKAFEKHAKNYGKECFDVPASRRFSGWDAYKQLLAENVDIVIHATPPVFRPLHLRAIVEAGKHMFVEKPACVDPVQARELMEIADMADKKGLSIIPGVQRRFHPGYQEIIKRVQDGQIGEIVSAQAYWLNSRFWIQNGGNLYLQNKDPMSMEYQIRNWFIFTRSPRKSTASAEGVSICNIRIWATALATLQLISISATACIAQVIAAANRSPRITSWSASWAQRA